MNHNPNPDQNSNVNLSPDFENQIQAEETLRLLAKLPAPESLTDRVHARVRHQIALDSAAPSRRGFWSLWSPGQRLQFAGAAVLAIAVTGSMWTINRAHHAGATPQQAITPTQPTSQPTSQSGFSSAKASRVPATLNPIKVPPAPKKKPSPKGAVKPTSKSSSAVTSRSVAAQPEPEPNR